MGLRPVRSSVPVQGCTLPTLPLVYGSACFSNQYLNMIINVDTVLMEVKTISLRHVNLLAEPSAPAGREFYCRTVLSFEFRSEYRLVSLLNCGA